MLTALKPTKELIREERQQQQPFDVRNNHLQLERPCTGRRRLLPVLIVVVNENNDVGNIGNDHNNLDGQAEQQVAEKVVAIFDGCSVWAENT